MKRKEKRELHIETSMEKLCQSRQSPGCFEGVVGWENDLCNLVIMTEDAQSWMFKEERFASERCSARGLALQRGWRMMSIFCLSDLAMFDCIGHVLPGLWAHGKHLYSPDRRHHR